MKKNLFRIILAAAVLVIWSNRQLYFYIEVMKMENYWERLIDCCYGKERNKLEIAIGAAMRPLRVDLGKLYVIVGEPASGKSSVMWNLIDGFSDAHWIMCDDVDCHNSSAYYRNDHINIWLTNEEPDISDLSKVTNDFEIIHTTGNRLNADEFKAAMDQIKNVDFRDNYLSVCLDKYEEELLNKIETFQEVGKTEKEIADELGFDIPSLRFYARRARSNRRKRHYMKACALREEGKTIEEISEALGLNESAVMSLFYQFD